LEVAMGQGRHRRPSSAMVEKQEEFSSLATQPTDFTHVVPFVGWPRNS